MCIEKAGARPWHPKRAFLLLELAFPNPTAQQSSNAEDCRCNPRSDECYVPGVLAHEIARQAGSEVE